MPGSAVQGEAGSGPGTRGIPQPLDARPRAQQQKRAEKGREGKKALGELRRGGSTHRPCEDASGPGAWLEGESLGSRFPPRGWRIAAPGRPQPGVPGLPWGTRVTPHGDIAQGTTPTRLLATNRRGDLYSPVSDEDNERLWAKHRSGTARPSPAPSLTLRHRSLSRSQPLIPAGAEPGSASREPA